MSKKSSKSSSSKKKKSGIGYLILLPVLMLLILGGIFGLRYMKDQGMLSGKEAESPAEPIAQVEESAEENPGGMTSEKWKEGTISYNGKYYQFNKDLDLYLLMGIDTDETVQAAVNYKEGGQADAIFLLAADREKKELTAVSIHRNTMTQIYTCDEAGNSTGYVEAQICLAHGYGDGKRLSCLRTVDAVSNLFYGLPIDGFVSINLGGIEPLNSVVGGVKLEVLDDINVGDVHLTKGETVTLTDKEAYYYLRNRRTSEFDSATNRMKRHQQYIDHFLQQLKSGVKGGLIGASKLYDSIADYCVTDLPLSTLIKTLKDYTYDSDRMYNLPGEVTQPGEFEEFHVDDDALYEMILDLFYVEVEQN